MSMIPSNSAPKSVRIYDVLPDGDYPARITRFVGLGVQPQPAFQGQAKDPAFKAMFEYELIGVDATGVEVKNMGKDNEERTPLEPTPACQFHDVFLFPGAKRGKVFDLCKVLDASLETVPNTLEWFKGKIGEVINVTVGSYVIKNGPNAGQRRNTVRGVSAVPGMFKSQVGEARRDFLYFDPYLDNETMFSAYSNLFKYQRDILAEAGDAANIPFAGKDPKPSEERAASAPASTASSAGTTSQSQESFNPDDDAPF